MFISLATFVEPAKGVLPPAQQQAMIDIVVDGTVAGKAARASSPLRKHKRKNAAPHRSAVGDGAEAADVAPAAEPEAWSKPKERRSGQAAPPAVTEQVDAAHSSRPRRNQHPAALPALPAGAPAAPDQLASVFEQSALLPPPLPGAMGAAPDLKVCAKCGTTTTPMWRTVNGVTYCNADGLRLKRKLGLL